MVGQGRKVQSKQIESHVQSYSYEKNKDSGALQRTELTIVNMLRRGISQAKPNCSCVIINECQSSVLLRGEEGHEKE